MENYLIINACQIGQKQNICVRIIDGKIAEIGERLSSKSENLINADGAYISAGFIDLHVHGGNGSDFMDATEKDFANITSFHAKHGTTGMLATTLTSSDEELFDTISCYNDFVKKQYSNLLGLHLEGPYFAFEQRGAQDARYLCEPNPKHYLPILNSSNHIKRWSIAPELNGAYELSKECQKRNILLSIGHSSSTTEQAKEALLNGFKLITHFYSGMNTVTRKNCFRVGGLIEAGYLYDEFFVEVIADGKHLPKELLQLIYKIKGADKIALITDCSSAAGLTEKTGHIGSRKNGQEVLIENGVAYLADKTSFAGSIATADILLDTMLKNVEISLENAVKMLTETPAKLLNISDRKGKIKVGYDADIVLFTANNKVDIKEVFIGGKKVE